MMRALNLAALSLAATVAASCAAPMDQPILAGAERQCFQNSDVSSFSDAGPDVALVSIGRRDAWELTLSPGCPDVDGAARIAIVSRGGGRICSGSDAELRIPNASGRGSQRCLVRNVRKLSPEEAAAVRN